VITRAARADTQLDRKDMEMLNFRIMAVALLGAGALAIGCVGPSDDLPEVDLDLPSEPRVGPIGANGMSPADFWVPSAQSALRTLGGGALLGGDGALVATPLLDTAAGRSVLDYAIRCALEGGASVISAGGLSFHGWFGVAPGWTGRGLTASEQRWVSACLFQHQNGLGLHVDIMLEGSLPALDPRPGEDPSQFTVKDATMFGNVFVPGVVTGYACVDLDIQLACPVDLSLTTLQRVCGGSPACGVTFLGLCDSVCDGDANGDPSCHTPLGLSYPQAIRSKVRDTDLVSLYPGCDVL
jgi:hypothetical protein